MNYFNQVKLTIRDNSEPLKILDGEDDNRKPLFHYLNGLIILNNTELNQIINKDIIPFRYKDFKVYKKPFNSKTFCELIEDFILQTDKILCKFNFYFSYGSNNLIFNIFNTLDLYLSKDIFKNQCFLKYKHIRYNYISLFSTITKNCIVPLSNIYDRNFNFTITIIDQNNNTTKSFIKNIHTFKNLNIILSSCITFKPVFIFHSIYYNYDYVPVITKKGKRLEPIQVNYGVKLYINELIIYTNDFEKMLNYVIN